MTDAHRTKEPITDAESLDRRLRDHTDTMYPVCPHCGYKERDAWEWGSAYDSGDKAWCGSCGREFFATRNVSVSWSTQP